MRSLQRHCDFLLINPPSPDGAVYIRDINRSGRRSRERTIWPQTSLAYLAAVAKNKGYTPNILDCIASEISWNQVHEYIKKNTPKWIVIEGISSTITNDLYSSFLGKRYGAKTVLVGPHITALPENTMEAYPSLDYGIVGEVEETLEELLDKSGNNEDITGISGLVFRNNGEIITNAERGFIQDLDSLPLPMFELLPLETYNAPYIGGPYVFVLHSRGCPNSCYFCRQNVMWKSSCRLRSGRSIAEEFRYLASIGVKKVAFHSDTFTQNRNNVLEICRELTAANTEIKWFCNGRIDLVDEEILNAMANAGCEMINYGIESGVQNILIQANKGEKATIEAARKAVQMTKDAGIAVWGYFMVGLPGETKETIRKTAAFAKELPLDLVNFSIATPYPGTPFYRQAEQNGWLRHVEWEDFDQNYSAVISYPNLSDKDIVAGVRQSYLAWYATPKGIKTFFKGLSSWRNIKTMVRIAIDHLTIK
ncbi:MAG: radical SAM protein [Deltaproteobacteria bacterium]|jgi:radical SAM superfamily enzyme YgiQ (UPF0313 family)|nr:radical SAM protein [Deltaproteobacteria bacterium]